MVTTTKKKRKQEDYWRFSLPRILLFFWVYGQKTRNTLKRDAPQKNKPEYMEFFYWDTSTYSLNVNKKKGTEKNPPK